MRRKDNHDLTPTLTSAVVLYIYSCGGAGGGQADYRFFRWNRRVTCANQRTNTNLFPLDLHNWRPLGQRRNAVPPCLEGILTFRANRPPYAPPTRIYINASATIVLYACRGFRQPAASWREKLTTRPKAQKNLPIPCVCLLRSINIAMYMHGYVGRIVPPTNHHLSEGRRLGMKSRGLPNTNYILCRVHKYSARCCGRNGRFGLTTAAAVLHQKKTNSI